METEISFAPNSSRFVLLDGAGGGRLVCMQVSRGSLACWAMLLCTPGLPRPLHARSPPAPQSGHPLHKLSVAAEQIERGAVIWDVAQTVPLGSVQVGPGWWGAGGGVDGSLGGGVGRSLTTPATSS